MASTQNHQCNQDVPLAQLILGFGYCQPVSCVRCRNARADSAQHTSSLLSAREPETTIALTTMGTPVQKAHPLVINVHTERVQYTTDADEATQEATRRALGHRNRYRSLAKPTTLTARDLHFL